VCVGARGNFRCVFEAVLQEHANQQVLGCLCSANEGILTPEASEPSELVGLLSVSCALAGSAMVVAAGCPGVQVQGSGRLCRRKVGSWGCAGGEVRAVGRGCQVVRRAVMGVGGHAKGR
jgi:hypothetical protein